MKIAYAFLSLLVLVLQVLPAHAGKPAKKPAHPKQVLFICTGNFYRSRFAQALFNGKAPAGWTASSRGLDTSTPRKTNVSPLVLEELERRHIAAERVAGTPQALTQADLDGADIVVLLNGEEHLPPLQHQFPSLKLDKVRQWSVPDVPRMSAPDAFAAIEKETDALVSKVALP